MTNELLAHFRFAGDGKDSCGKCADAVLKGTQFKGGTLFLNGAYEHGGGGGFRAIAPIKGLSHDSLTFSLDFYPRDFAPARSSGTLGNVLGLVSRFTGLPTPSLRRSGHENIVMGGSSYRWLGYRHEGGCLELTLNNQDFVHRFTNVVVSTKRWHNLVCSLDLKASRVLTFLDGRQLLPDVKLPDDFKLRIIGSEREPEDNEFTFTNYSDGRAFHGYAANLKVFSRALAATEIMDLLEAAPAERPGFKPPSVEASKWPILLLLVVGGVVWFKFFGSRAGGMK